MFRPRPERVKPILPGATEASGTLDADDRANELYWGSDRSVNQIAEDLDLSKGALYEMIRPLAAGLGCPMCGVEVVHPNRTAREKARVDCPACGWNGAEDEAVPGEEGPAEPIRDEPAAERGKRPDIEPVEEMYPEADFDYPGPPPVTVTDDEARARRFVAGGALLGAAVGLALVIWARRR